MCAVCGLPATHSNVAQFFGWATLFSFTLATFLSAWWVVTSLKVKKGFKSLREKDGRKKFASNALGNKGKSH